jgi:hypothetical protein
MDRVSPKHHSWTPLVATLVAPLAAIARRFLAGLHETRQQEATRILERYRDLTKDTDADRR